MINKYPRAFQVILRTKAFLKIGKWKGHKRQKENKKTISVVYR